MKKTILLALAFGVTTAFAQENTGLVSKKGEKYLPESGDWAIGFQASPFLDYVGNMFGKTANNTSPSAQGGINDWTFMGKMFKDEKTAYRAMIGLNFGSVKTTNLVYDDQVGVATPDVDKRVEDSRKVSSRSITLGGGLEMRRGSTRLQGYYGGMAMITLGGGKTTYEYGNAIDAINNPTPTSTDWSTMTSVSSGSRTLSNKSGGTFGLDIVGFLGAEYFVLPKLSIGAEYQWGIGFSSTGAGEIETESVNSLGTGVETKTTETGKSSSFGIGNGIGNASLVLMLHF